MSGEISLSDFVSFTYDETFGDVLEGWTVERIRRFSDGTDAFAFWNESKDEYPRERPFVVDEEKYATFFKSQYRDFDATNEYVVENVISPEIED